MFILLLLPIWQRCRIWVFFLSFPQPLHLLYLSTYAYLSKYIVYKALKKSKIKTKKNIFSEKYFCNHIYLNLLPKKVQLFFEKKSFIFFVLPFFILKNNIFLKPFLKTTYTDNQLFIYIFIYF